MLSLLALPLVFALGLTQVAANNWAYSDGTNFHPVNGTVNPTPAAPIPTDFYDQLLLAPDAVSRYNLLNGYNNGDASAWKFNFNPTFNSSFASRGAGGLAVLATRNSFPALIGLGVSVAMGFLEPCGLNAPHFHPRATQLVTVVQGGPLTAGGLWTNAAAKEQFTTTVNTWEMIALGQGSVHWVFNDNCHPTITTNAFSSDDPGIINIGPTLFKMNSDILNGTLGYPAQLNGYSPTEFLNGIPPSYVYGSQACMQRCGIPMSAIYAS